MLRTFLALTVLIYHVYWDVFVGPWLAVQLFYVISGFLISYVLLDARSYGTVRAFYENRVLRLFPIYWIVASATLLMFIVGSLAGATPPFFDVYREVGEVGAWALIVSNIIIFGQDIIMFTGVHDGVFQFSMNYLESEVVVWHGLIAPQAWTLALELMFYAIAPFVMGRLKLTIALLVMSVGLRLIFIHMGFGDNDPWSYRFFPTELALFLTGALSHQLWMPLVRQRGWISAGTGWAALALVLALCVAYPMAPSRVGMVIVVALALPFLFEFQRQQKWDRWIGDLSYPIYISHFLIMFPISWVWDKMTGSIGYRGVDETIAVIVVTLLFSIALKIWVSDPLERVRDKVRRAPRSAVEVAG